MKKPKALAFGFFTPVLWWGGAWACGWGLPDCGLSAAIVLKRPLLKAPEDICIIPLARFVACKVWPNIWRCSYTQRNREEQDGKADYRHAPQQYRYCAGDKPCRIEAHFTLEISTQSALLFYAMKNTLLIFAAASVVSACATPARYDYVKEGVSEHQRTDAVSECNYQIRLNKTPAIEQAELLKLCMQGKGFRLKRVN